MHRWSPHADREFHDALFAAQRYDPFTFGYAGYITIRRFAELTEPYLSGVRHAVDLGCGPGEITCELARRNPHIRFAGIDHSEAAIERAREHQAGLGLANVEFSAGDISAIRPEGVDIVLMYDSFHHLLDPAAFVRALKPSVSRFVLVEPAGDWLGGWQKTLEFDWIPSALDAVRARLAWQLDDGAQAAGPPGGAPVDRGEPVEHRYTLGDLKSFFEGYGLDVRGTIAGIDRYPPNPHAALPLREDFGRIAADALAAVEDALMRHDLDLHAKHWVVHAERGAPHRIRTPKPVNARVRETPPAGQGPYDVEYLLWEGPSVCRPSAVFPATLTLKNAGWRPWSSQGEPPVFVSYHWLDANGALMPGDGRRSPLPRPLARGETLSMTCMVEAPPAAGRYTLAIDLVEEGVTWFSHAGAPLYRARVVVRA
jgi:SAM-dependent methyltransferase